MTPLIASSAVFILIKLCGMGKFLRVKNKCLKPVASVLSITYTKSASQWGTAGFLFLF